MRSRTLPSPPSRTVVAVVAAVFTLVLTSVGTVWATHSTGLIDACAHNTTGALRLVDDPNDCKHAETPVHWNADGPQGPQGVPGPQGPEGPQGPPGSGAAAGQSCDVDAVVTGIDTDGTLVCTGIDEVAGNVDADQDGWTLADGDCDDTDPTVNPGADEVFGDGLDDGVDNDCDGLIDEGVPDSELDADGDGFTPNGGDCNDDDDTVHPGATDIPDDGIDQDCDGSDLSTYFIDLDEDSYGNHQGTTAVLAEPTPPAGYSLSSDDCDDSDPSIHPGAADSTGDGIDQDCDGVDG